jgi:transposase
MPWVLAGCWMNSNLTIMDKQTTQSALTEEVSKNNDPKQVKAKQIFLGIDAHMARNQVARKKDKGGIQAVQSLSFFEELLLFAQKQLSLAEEVYAVYEAGPLGYVLYRRLRELGIRAYVSAPECLEQGKRKHNKLDARKLDSRLYSYVRGDSEMLRVVRVPTPDQERLRAQSRQHDQLVATRKAIGAQGRALVLNQGHGMMKETWWRPMAYSKRAPFLLEWIRAELEVWQANLRLSDVQIAQHKKGAAQEKEYYVR